jgi:hypothetical protein
MQFLFIVFENGDEATEMDGIEEIGSFNAKGVVI